AGTGVHVVRRPWRGGNGRADHERCAANGRQQLHRFVVPQRREQRDAREQPHAGTAGRRPERSESADQGVGGEGRDRRGECSGPCLGAFLCEDANAQSAGPIIRDRLWFFLSTKSQGTRLYVSGMYYNKNAGNPNAWTYDPDQSRRAIYDGTWTNVPLRLTWQATPRNKFNIFLDAQTQ